MKPNPTRGPFWSLLAVACLGAAPLVAQRTWIVDADNRPGTDYRDLPPAISAAAAGDTIRVRIPTANGYQNFSYHSPLSIPYILKPLFIVGDSGPVRPRVAGGWTVHGIPAGATFMLANIEGIRTLDGSGGAGLAGVGVNAYQCPGTIVVDNHKLTFANGGSVIFAGCGLGVISHCSFDSSKGVTCDGSTVMIDESIIQCHNMPAAGFYNTPEGTISSTSSNEGRGGTEAIMNYTGTVLVSNSTLIGASATVPFYGINAKNALWMDFANGASVGGTTIIGKNCTVSAGSYYGGGPSNLNGASSPLYHPGVTLIVDPGTIVNSLWRPDLVETFAQVPQTALGYTATPTSLQITQAATPLSACVLAIGPVATPWSSTAGITLGPVCIDPASYSEYWSLAGATGSVTTNFAIPPGLPVGYQVAVQCFELMTTGTINTSNAAVVQIRP